MNSKLFAFNVAQDMTGTPIDAPDAHYDAQEQVLLGTTNADYRSYASASAPNKDRRSNLDGYIQDGYTKNDMCG
jgi:hypothetical protein